jgi:hypothetical protein
MHANLHQLHTYIYIHAGSCNYNKYPLACPYHISRCSSILGWDHSNFAAIHSVVPHITALAVVSMCAVLNTNLTVALAALPPHTFVRPPCCFYWVYEFQKNEFRVTSLWIISVSEFNRIISPDSDERETVVISLRPRKPRLRPWGSVTLTTWHPLSGKIVTKAPTSSTNGGCSVGLVRSRTQATEFVCG